MTNRKQRKLHVDVAIVGAGVTGLLLSHKLADIGVSVLLIEKNAVIAGSSSIRNEGWLHRGTYHAASIKDRTNAIQVSRRCAYGYDQISRYAAESVEDIDVPSFALIHNKNRVDEILSRWDEAEIPHRQVRLLDFESLVPEVDISRIAYVFQVKDIGINTRVLYKKLLHDCERSGVRVFRRASVSFHGQNEAQISFGESIHTIEAKIFIFATGYETKTLFKSYFGIEIPLRTWKSHLIITHKLAKYSIFYLDAGEAAMVNHGKYCIVGLNEDAFQCEDTNTECVSEKVMDVLAAISRLFKKANNIDYSPVACIKTDLVISTGLDRSLNIAICEPLPNYFCTLPGKMTEAPYLTDVMVRIICDKLSDSRIAERPLDQWVRDRGGDR